MDSTTISPIKFCTLNHETIFLIYLENFCIVNDLNFGGIRLVAKDFFRFEILWFDFRD